MFTGIESYSSFPRRRESAIYQTSIDSRLRGNDNNKAQTRVTLIVLSVMSLFSSNLFAGIPMPEVPKAIKGEQCVEETAFMRRNHMDLLDHQRDDTMHRGIRTKKHSLNGCLTCHAVLDDAKQPVTIKSENHFCNSCHTYAAVKIDCFGCHESTPGDEKTIVSKRP